MAARTANNAPTAEEITLAQQQYAQALQEAKAALGTPEHAAKVEALTVASDTLGAVVERLPDTSPGVQPRAF